MYKHCLFKVLEWGRTISIQNAIGQTESLDRILEYIKKSIDVLIETGEFKGAKIIRVRGRGADEEVAVRDCIVEALSMNGFYGTVAWYDEDFKKYQILATNNEKDFPLKSFVQS